MPSYGSTSYGLGILQQGAEDMAKARAEAQKAEAEAIGKRGLYDIAVKQGVLDPQQQLEFNRGNAAKKNEILTGAMLTFHAQQQVQEAEQRKQAFQLQQDEAKRAAARAAWTPPPGLDETLAKSNQQIVQTGGGGQFQIVPKAPPPIPPEVQSQFEANIRKTGRTPVYDPTTKKYDVYAPLVPPTPPPVTVPYRVPGGKPIPVSPSSELGQSVLKEMNPERELFNKYGMTGAEFTDPKNLKIGKYNKELESFVGTEPGEASHANVAGNILPLGEYNTWKRKLDAAQKAAKAQEQRAQNINLGVKMKSPDGKTEYNVPVDQVDYYKNLGATVIEE